MKLAIYSWEKFEDLVKDPIRYILCFRDPRSVYQGGRLKDCVWSTIESPKLIIPVGSLGKQLESLSRYITTLKSTTRIGHTCNAQRHECWVRNIIFSTRGNQHQVYPNGKWMQKSCYFDSFTLFALYHYKDPSEIVELTRQFLSLRAL